MAAEKLITEHLDLWTAAIKRRSAAGRGSSRKIELYGIKKLRELILELAVRGLLVPQDPKDEPASELLKKIAAEKATLVKEGKIKKDKPLLPIGEKERAFEVPKGWLWERFGNLAEHNAGKTLDQGRNQGELRDYITTSNLYWGRFDLSTVRQMPLEDADLEKCQAIQDDLLICEGGEAGRAAVWNHDYPICFQNHIHRARFWQGINPYYAYRLLEKMSYSGEIDDYRKGVGISNMSGKALGSIPFPLPPLVEQHRIVAKVDELMVLCDQLEQQIDASLSAHQTLVETLLNALTSAVDHAQFASAWQRIAEHFDTLFTTEESIYQLKQTILQLAVMGKLVPQDPNDEPASELLKKIAAEKVKLVKEGKIKKEIPLARIGGEEKPFELPEKWEWSRLIEISANIHYGYTASSDDGIKSVRLLRITDIQDDVVDWDSVPGCEIEADKIAQYKLVDEDILIARTGGTIGKSYLVQDINVCAVFASYLIRIRHLKGMSAHYKKIYLGSQLYWRQLYAKSMGTGQPNVNGASLKGLVVPVPPLVEQHRIVAKVHELMALCDQLKSRLSDVQITQLHLADALAEQALMEA